MRQTERGNRSDDKRSETAMEDRKNKDIFRKDMLDNNQLLRFTTAGSVDDGKVRSLEDCCLIPSQFLRINSRPLKAQVKERTRRC